nr:uncharacterized protein LOC128691587 [Cherax quadricarinatus]
MVTEIYLWMSISWSTEYLVWRPKVQQIRGTRIESYKVNYPEADLAKITDHLLIPGGAAFFEAVINGSNFNQRDMDFSFLVDNVKMLRKLSSYTTVVVISDEATFLAAFVKWSVKGRLMVWSMRLLILTHSRLMELQDLHTTLSNLNSMLVIINDDTTNIRCSVYVQLPYSPRGSQVVQVASWTPRRGLHLTSHLPLFPEKFSK